MKDFKKQYHLAEAAAAAISVTNIGFNLKAEKGKAVEITLDLPPEDQIARLSTLLRPLINTPYRGVESRNYD